MHPLGLMAKALVAIVSSGTWWTAEEVLSIKCCMLLVVLEHVIVVRYCYPSIYSK